jgi:GT2 family glycosyltransferase
MSWQSGTGQILIGDGTSAELFLHVGAAERVSIGKDVMIGGHVTILDHDHTWQDYSRPPRYQGLTVAPTTIGDGAWIGEGAFIGKGVNIGPGAIVGAHSVVLRDVPAHAVVAGNPARIIKYREPAQGLTSIIIPTINLERVRACIDRIHACTPEPHEVIVVDNSKDNRGWVGGCNFGLKQASGSYLLLLNDDVTVTPGWLGRLLGTLQRYPEVGLVGPVSDYVAGPQQVPASYRAEEHWGESQQVEVLIGFCLLMRREVYEKIGGLDPRFGLGNFDDNDYCLRAALAGYKLRIVRDCWVHHEGGQTFKELGIDYAASLAENKARFCEKWGIAVEPEEVLA